MQWENFSEKGVVFLKRRGNMTGDLKRRALSIVESRNLCSCMNDTKWGEFRRAMLKEMPFPPPYILKTIFEDECPQEKYFQKDVTWIGDWEEGFLYDEYLDAKEWFVIEWVKVRPRHLKSRGKLIEPECVDAAGKFEEILEKCSIPYEENNGVYCIYGYR